MSLFGAVALRRSRHIRPQVDDMAEAIGGGQVGHQRHDSRSVALDRKHARSGAVDQARSGPDPRCTVDEHPLPDLAAELPCLKLRSKVVTCRLRSSRPRASTGLVAVSILVLQGVEKTSRSMPDPSGFFRLSGCIRRPGASPPTATSTHTVYLHKEPPA